MLLASGRGKENHSYDFFIFSLLVCSLPLFTPILLAEEQQAVRYFSFFETKRSIH